MMVQRVDDAWRSRWQSGSLVPPHLRRQKIDVDDGLRAARFALLDLPGLAGDDRAAREAIDGAYRALDQFVGAFESWKEKEWRDQP